MTIDSLFEKYPENIFGVRLSGTNVRVIDFWMKNTWEILEEHVNDNVQIKKQKEEPEKSYWILFSDVINFEELYKHVSKIIEHNLEMEQKQELFNHKLNELKNMFLNGKYEELKNLNFNVGNPSTSLTTPSLNEKLSKTEN